MSIATLTAPAELTADAQIFEYSKAANPVESGATPRIPVREFGAALIASPGTRIVPLDVSADLRVPYPATSPSLLASFVRIEAGETVRTAPNASSQIFYVIRGAGVTEHEEGAIEWQAGDFVVLPACAATHRATETAAFYMVDDSPLFAYLGARRGEQRFRPTVYSRVTVLAQLEAARNEPEAANRSRVSVLLANRNFEQTMTVTHTLWTMFGVVPPGMRQLPHRHQSVALDFVVQAVPGAYTLLGPELRRDGTILDPIRVDWATGAAFVTPPGWWHEHRNDSGADAFVMPIQDAGLHTYLRTLDIQFYEED